MPDLFIKSPESLEALIRESMSYSCLSSETRQQWIQHGLLEWYLPLARDGYSAIPSFVILDIGTRIVHQGQTVRRAPGNAPDGARYHRYAQALDTLFRDTTNRDILADLSLHGNDVGIVHFLQHVLKPPLSKMETLVAIDEPVFSAIYRATAAMGIPSVVITYGHLFEDFIDAFTASILDDIGNTGEMQTRQDKEARRIVLAAALQEDALSYPDIELIDLCSRMDDLPPLGSHDQSSLVRTLQTIHLEQPMTRSSNPEGGYVGIRNNGGIEDLSNPIMSEWANPAPVLWEKLTNRSLLIYERASRTVHVRRMLLHLTFLNHSSIMQVQEGAITVPAVRVKHLMTAIARDLAAYLSQVKTADIQLNLQIVSYAHSEFQVHSVNLNDIPADRVRNPHHFLLDERDVFPSFFSSNLGDTPSFRSEDEGREYREGTSGLVEECQPERDIMFGEHAGGFENIHNLVFCSRTDYDESRDRIVEHMRDYLDLSLTSLDSLLFVVMNTDEQEAGGAEWFVDPVHQFHRNSHTDPLSDSPNSSPVHGSLLTARQARNTVRHNFLSRLLGARFQLPAPPVE
jgi:hypothetical protein